MNRHGLASACYLFTKITRPLVKKWRSEGKQIIMYLDDGIGIDPDEQLCQNIANEVKIDLIKSGFVPLLISILKCLVIKYTILPMTEYVEIICPTKDATFLTYTVLRTDKHEQISVIVLIIFSTVYFTNFLYYLSD
jgi:hypothetical protein